MATGFHIHQVRTQDDLIALAALFEAYAASLDVDLGYQDFASELVALPGKYARPEGELLLARRNGQEPIGCVGLRPLPSEGVCEMKRLYVAPNGRGSGVGKALMLAIIEEGRQRGYREMWLDTLPTMAAAQAMYLGAGFEPLEPYYDTPVSGTLFLRLVLGRV